MAKKRILVVAALPLLMGSRCGITFDFTETFLVTDPVHLIVLDVDNGNLDAVAYDRPAILLKRHTFGFEGQLKDPVFTVEDGVATYEGHCKPEKRDRKPICSFDHMFELPFGVAFDVKLLEAHIDVGYLDADFKGEFETGDFTGVRLSVPALELTAHSAEIDAHYAGIPESITIDIDEGDVVLALPAGDYRCSFDADDVTNDSGAIVCNDAAMAVLDIRVGDGAITITEAQP
ncbi:MAG TPA: hypothetical protein VG755_08640 [Nannocystaceae bacterium]|nr:hypothetical protein [Nannocystaceae bacterium]